jgi:glutamyl-tRNA reductase
MYRKTKRIEENRECKRKKEREKWSETGKEITNEATEIEKKKKNGRKREERKIQSVCVSFCNKLMKNLTQKLVHFPVTNNPVHMSPQGSVRTSSVSLYYQFLMCNIQI